MGLDIRGYSNVKEIKNPRVDDTDELINPYIGEFIYQAGNLVSGGYYEVGECGGAFSMGYGGYGFF